jgi:DNA-binding NarL/FixJ family response regulator
MTRRTWSNLSRELQDLHLPSKTASIRQQNMLSSRERQILQLIVDGKSNREIASELGLSPNTVAVHRGNMMKALGCHNTATLVVHAIREQLVEIH